MKKRTLFLMVVLVLLSTMAFATATQDTAFLMYADENWTLQYMDGGAAANGIVATNATITGAGSYTVGLDFTHTTAGKATGLAFTAVGIKTGEQTFPGAFIHITAIRVNGQPVTFQKGYTSSDDRIVTRENIYNSFVSTLPADARSYDGNTSDSHPMMVDKAAFAEVRTVQVDFDFTLGGAAATAAAAATPALDVATALAATYNAYFGVQTTSYIFRNAWNDNYGKTTPNWTHLTGWNGPAEVDYGGTFTDAVINGNGTYTVGVQLGTMGFGQDQAFNLLFVSTDIPSVLITDHHVTIDNVKTTMDSGTARPYTFVDTSGQYATISVMNTYNHAVGTETIPFSMPSHSIDISFMISGLASKGLPVWALIIIIAAGVIVVAGVVIFLVARKKKPAQKTE